MGIFNRFPGQEARSRNTDAGQRETSSDVLPIDSLATAVMWLDRQGRLLRLNASARDLLRGAGIDSPAALEGQELCALLGEQAPPLLREDLRTSRGEAVELGGQAWRLSATPLSEGRGTLLEWREAAGEREREHEISALKEQARQLSFHRSCLKTGIDGATAGVILVDNEGKIFYINDAFKAMLRHAEAEIRRKLPDFDIERIIGSEAEPFHQASCGNQVPLAQRTTTEYGTVSTAGRSYLHTVSPIYNEDNERVGTLIKWLDRTLQGVFESVLNNAIDKAVKGDIDSRIHLDVEDQFLKSTAERINSLIDAFAGIVKDAGASLAAVATGDLTRKITRDYQGSYGKLKDDINTTIDQLVEIVGEIREGTHAIREGAGEVASGNASLSQRTEEQAASLEETSAAMEEITTTVQQNAANSQQANALARQARETAENGGSVVGQAISAMQAISESSNKISDIISVIDEIAFQTNLLSLNAAVEAARAGEQGRGFAVVADEVRSLAGRSATAAKEIKDLIKDSVEKVKEGSSLVNRSGETLNDIVVAVKKVNDIVAEISTASEEQASGLDEVNKAVGEMDDMTQQNAALVEQAAAASEALDSQAQALESLMVFFKTGERDDRVSGQGSVEHIDWQRLSASARRDGELRVKRQDASSKPDSAGRNGRAAANGRPPSTREARKPVAADQDWSEF